MSDKIMLKEFIRLPTPEVLNYNGANYVREGRGPRIGVMVALDKNRWGWSVISPQENLHDCIPAQREIEIKGKKKIINYSEKVWNSENIWERGTFIALDRAMNPELTPEIVPAAAKASINRFKERMDRYFKA